MLGVGGGGGGGMNLTLSPSPSLTLFLVLILFSFALRVFTLVFYFSPSRKNNATLTQCKEAGVEEKRVAAVNCKRYFLSKSSRGRRGKSKKRQRVVVDFSFVVDYGVVSTWKLRF